MKKPLGLTGSALVVSALLLSGTVLAQDPEFRFSIPVNVKKLHPNAVSVGIVCTPFDASGTFMNFDVAHSLADEPKLDATGSYAGTLKSSIKLFNPADAVKVKSYSCSLRVTSNSGSTKQPEDCADPLWEWYCLKPGSARTLVVKGPIP